jgi:uncharacterized membrane-anchored protein YitT (DUF2179 family)
MVESTNKKNTQNVVLTELKNIIFVLIGCLLLAFADAVFLTPCKIVSGGVVSVGIIVNHYVEAATGFDCTDIVVALVQVLLWTIGWFTLGKKFSLNTLLASFSYPVFYAILYRLNVGSLLHIEQALYPNPSQIGTGELILAGIFGGALAGAGVAISYLGNGSTGGFDIVSFIIAKYSDMKQDVSGFIIDSSLIVIGMLCIQNILLSLVGIISALACAVAVQYIYVNADTFVIVDIISDKTDEIQEFIHKDMDHATTIFDTVGGYTGEKRKMIRVVIYQVETSELRTRIAMIDPRAFVSFTTAKTINGEGFEPLIVPKASFKRSLHRSSHDLQYEIADEKKRNSQRKAEKDAAKMVASHPSPSVPTPDKPSEEKK